MTVGKRRKRLRHKRPSVASKGKRVASQDRSRTAVRFLLPLVVFLWPVLYLFDHVFPINGQYTAAGNDFYELYYKYKVYLLAHLSEFSFPLWSPAEGAGFPFYTNPFAQAFYPFNLLLAVWYKISGGYNVHDHHVFTVLGISIFALGLFLWLRLINTNLRAVLFAVLVMSVSFRMTEILRFPNAVHSAAWYPWVLYALTKIMLSPSLRKAALNGILLTVFLICLCTGGYPYYVYYSQFLFVPYVIVFLVKPLRLRLLGAHAVHWKRAVVTFAVAGFVALLICGPYFVCIKNLQSETADRAGKDFAYSTKHIFNTEDTLGSLVYPPAASTEGWYFFSITALLLVLLYIVKGKATTCGGVRAVNGRKEMSISSGHQDLWPRLFLLIWIAVITYITYGRSSYLFILLWNFMPGFSGLRNFGRMNIILVPILAWLLSLAYASFESLIAGKTRPAGRKRSWASSPLVAILIAYIVILCAQLYLYLYGIYDGLWLRYFQHLSPKRAGFIFYGAVAFVTISVLAILAGRTALRSRRSLTAVLAVLLVVAVLEMRPVGARTWTFKAEVRKNRIHLDIAKINKASFRFPRTDHNNSVSLRPNFSVGILENWYFTRYIKFLKETEDELEARKELLGVYDGTKIFFSESVEHTTIESFLRDARRYRQHNTGRLLSYTGEDLRWEINAPVAGYLSFIDNWDDGWKVCVDNVPAKIELLFGTFKSVRLTPGWHRVRFYYQPRILFLYKKAGSE